ncbi:FXYD domain-containing ion transport regulator 5 isoform X2 [Cricetulus griseus]|uniref:FXYD domain-containing ion transport regulator n=1 Tax=Cricetulus griseus TaxID=10029 RepID=A0A9J7H7G0_CRIGR|nr:FXYD domain-containing ion transport regulator 5 isoform X2 [Cricetulus griseus]
MQMSPSWRLCLLTFVALILLSRGQTPETATSSSTVGGTSVNTHAPDPAFTPVPDKTNPEVQPTTPTPTWEVHGTPALPGIRSPSPTEDYWERFFFHEPQDSKENSPFYYDDFTLRKRGLLVAAVLFITGIIILTSGKCRHLSRMCLNRQRLLPLGSLSQQQNADILGSDHSSEGLTQPLGAVNLVGTEVFISLCYMYGHFAYIYVCVTHVCSVLEARRQHHISWVWKL